MTSDEIISDDNTNDNNTSDIARILIVDDHREALKSMGFILKEAGYRIDCVSSAIQALLRMQQNSYDLVITDLNMPGMSGLEFLQKLQNQPHGAQILMVTAHASVTTAVNAIRLGAFDYIEKPFSVDQLEHLVARALEHGRLIDQNEKLKSTSSGQVNVSMIGESEPMRLLKTRIAQLAPTLETVLILGESGTGKELVARSVHQSSRRANSELVSLNCPVLSAQLMESELFGHEKGAFTGAETHRIGRFELADGGSILLDEITEIDPSLQAKLLRVLQEKSFERVGSSETISVDVRVIATTNRDLLQEVYDGNFRQDLYYRLAVLPINVPPLRQRTEDLPLLVKHFFQRTASRLQNEPCQLESAALDLLINYHWPGNVRELENIITRSSVLYPEKTIAADDIRSWLIDYDCQESAANSSQVPVGLSLQAMEKKLILATLEQFDGHRAKTAKALGIGIRTLSGKLKSYGYAPRTKSFAKAA